MFMSQSQRRRLFRRELQLVQSANRKHFKQYLRQVAEVKKAEMELVNTCRADSAIGELSYKEAKYYVSMLTYLHNGDKPNFEKYKAKLQEAMSELLTAIMENKADANALFLASSTEKQSTMVRNEEIARVQGQKMKDVFECIEFNEKMADECCLWK